MSYEATLDTDKTIQIASNTGWFNASDWMEDLGDEYPEIAHLVEHGWNEPASDVADELEDALANDPPDDDDVAKTVQGLIEFARSGEHDATLVISNGMGGGGDEEDDDDDYDDADYEETGR